MKTIKVGLIPVKSDYENFNKELAEEIVKYAEEHKAEKEDIAEIIAKIDENGDTDVEIEYVQPNKIERLRRITG